MDDQSHASAALISNVHLSTKKRDVPCARQTHAPALKIHNKYVALDDQTKLKQNLK